MKAKILRALPAAKALLIGGPTPDSGGKLYDLWRNSPAIKRVLTLGRVSFKKKRLPIIFSLWASSGTAGRFIGVGTTTDIKNYGFAPQWFRMDWHPDHGKKSYDWTDPPFHFHVNHFV